MTGKRRFLSYIAAVVAMSAVEIVTSGGNPTPQGMSMQFMQALVGVSAIHFTGVAADKVMKHRHGGQES